MKRILSAIISMMMLVSVFGAFSALAADTNEYSYYTQVGASFIPNTNAAEDGVTWTNATAAVDTSQMGRRVIHGTRNGEAVKGIVNVGVKKYASYQDNEGMTVGEDLFYGNDYKNQWRYAGKSDPNTNLAVYSKEPGNANNTVVKYQVNSTTQNQIVYYPSNVPGATDDFTVEMRIMLDENTADNYSHAIQIKDADSKNDQLVIKWNGSSISFKINSTSATKNPKAKLGEWLNLKFVVKRVNGDNPATITLYENETEYINTASNLVSNLDYLYIQDENRKSPYPYVLVDDVKITNESTTDYIYYDNFKSEYNYDFIKAAGTQALTVNENLKLVDQNGNDSGFSKPVYASVTADTSKLGKFTHSTPIAGFDEPLNISWTVYQKSVAFSENFQGYEESGIGSAPTFDPFNGDITGRTVEYENEAAGVDSNKWLKYTSQYTGSNKDDCTIFWENEYIDGKVEVTMTVNVPELYKDGNFAMPILGNRQSGDSFQINIDHTDPAKVRTVSGSNHVALIDLNVSFGTDKTTGDARGGIYFKKYDNGYRTVSSGNEYIVPAGELEVNADYILKFIIDLDTDTFTYSLNGVESGKTFRTYIEDAYLSQIRLKQTKADLDYPVTMYLDDLAVTKYLTLSQPVAQSMTVYKGDSVTLPATVPVILSDSRTRVDAQVEWNSSIDSNNVQTQTIYGTVEGTDARASLTATVSPFPYEIQMPILQYNNSEVFGLINGGKVTALSVKKISNNTVAGKVYAAIFHNGAIKAVASAPINTQNAWEKGALADVPVTLEFALGNDINIDECTLYSYIFSDNMVPLSLSTALRNTAPEGEPVIWMAGDSTAARYTDSRRPQTGWMEAFASTYASNLTVQNGTLNGQGGISGTGAIGGQSSKSYVEQGRLEKIINNAKEGDYLFIQFGHNDSHGETYRHTDPGDWADETKSVWVPGTYEDYMEIFVTEARKAGLKPVILTNVVRATFLSNGTFTGRTKAALDRYAQGARYVASKHHVPLVEVFNPTCDHIEEIGLEQSKQYYMYVNYCDAADASECKNYIDHSYCESWNKTLESKDGKKLEDSTHLNTKGAAWIAEIVYGGICDLKLPLANLLTK